MNTTVTGLDRKGLRNDPSPRAERRLAALALALIVGASCATSGPGPEQRDATSGPARAGQDSGSRAPAQAAASGSATPHASASAAKAQENDVRRFAELVDGLSEKDEYFFSDNLISNETSYLQIASELRDLATPSGVYVGVGPEQNFSYIALTRPTQAFIVDIRRGNTLLHLLYRAAFEEASGRASFLALLTGRSFAGKDEAASDGIDQVLALAQGGDATEATYKAAHERLMKRVEGYGVKLVQGDRDALEKTHRAFFEDQLALRFQLKEKNGRLYPTLKELLSSRDPSNKIGGFLASDESFRFLQSMQKAGAIVPIVGDFAGDKAVPQLAAYLKSEGKTVSTFYVSNVEQYLLEPKVWKSWSRNVKALPKDDKSLFIRAYLDQGKKHPSQPKGQRTATVLAKMKDFDDTFGTKPTATFFALCTERLVAPR